jgi:hypothetical protein
MHERNPLPPSRPRPRAPYAEPGGWVLWLVPLVVGFLLGVGVASGHLPGDLPVEAIARCRALLRETP